MVLEDVITAICTVGFPIVCTLIMFYYNYKLTEYHRTETNELRTSIENNTLAINTLIAKLDVDTNARI